MAVDDLEPKSDSESENEDDDLGFLVQCGVLWMFIVFCMVLYWGVYDPCNLMPF